MLLTPYSAAPGRECGACTLCCKVYALPEFAKPPGVWCKHCAPGKGCAIHEAPPDQCRQFFCLWMTDGTMPAEWKPDQARFVLSILSDKRIHLWSGGSRRAGSVAQGALFRGLTSDGEKAAGTEAACHHVRWRSSDARHARRDLVSRRHDGQRQFSHRAGLRPERAHMARDENMRKIVRLCSWSLALAFAIAFVSPAMAELATTGAPVAMRAEPTGKAGIVQHIPQSAEISLEKCVRNWCRASWRGRFGYLPEEAVVLGPPPRPCLATRCRRRWGLRRQPTSRPRRFDGQALCRR